MHGLLIVDKPAGPTSHDVVSRVRRVVGPARVGHTGTLDPMATGVLVLCLGAATRLARFLSGGSKEYQGEAAFGATTDTYDSTGKVVEEKPVLGLSLDAARRGASAFVGDLSQVPPTWSAKKIGGQRAYDLARSGDPRELAPCAVRIEVFDILDLQGTRAAFRVVCSGGTYIRSLVHDLGKALGCGAHLAALRRTANGAFSISGAHELPAIEKAAAAGTLASLVLPLETLDLGLSEMRLTEAAERLAAAGRFIPAESIPDPLERRAGQLVRLVTPAGRLLGIGEVAADGHPGVQPRIVLGSRPA